VVCFGKLEEDSSLKLSKSWIDLIDSLAMRFGDEVLLDAWASKRPQPIAAPVQQLSQNLVSLGYGMTSYATEYDPTKVFVTSVFKSTTPPISSVPLEEGEYMPKSPVYAPSSPPYAPTSPIDEEL
jgi:hypothetical protein